MFISVFALQRAHFLCKDNIFKDLVAVSAPFLSFKPVLETFFNFGIVYKQERSIKEITSEETDFIDVSFEGEVGGDIFSLTPPSNP